MTQQQFTEQRFLEDVDCGDAAIGEMLFNAHQEQVYHSQREGLSVGQSSLSMFERMGRPVVERTGRLLWQMVRSWTLNTHKLELFWTERNSNSSPNVTRRLRNTSSMLIMTEEVYKNWVRLLSLNRKNFIALKLKNFNDEINTTSSCTVIAAKLGIFVKLMRKVSVRWKNWSDFKALHSAQLRGDNWSKIQILSLNSQVRFRNYRMKLVAVFIFYMVELVRFMWDSLSFRKSRRRCTKCLSERGDVLLAVFCTILRKTIFMNSFYFVTDWSFTADGGLL